MGHWTDRLHSFFSFILLGIYLTYSQRECVFVSIKSVSLFSTFSPMYTTHGVDGVCSVFLFFSSEKCLHLASASHISYLALYLLLVFINRLFMYIYPNLGNSYINHLILSETIYPTPIFVSRLSLIFASTSPYIYNRYIRRRSSILISLPGYFLEQTSYTRSYSKIASDKL